MSHAVIVDLHDLWEPAVVVLLLAILVSLRLLPGWTANRLARGDIAADLRQISRSAADAAKRVRALDRELAATEEVGRWRSIMQTALGAVIGISGGFLGPWVSNAGLGVGFARAVFVLAVGLAAVFLVSTTLFPYLDERLKSRRERKAKQANGAALELKGP